MRYIITAACTLRAFQLHACHEIITFRSICKVVGLQIVCAASILIAHHLHFVYINHWSHMVRARPITIPHIYWFRIYELWDRVEQVLLDRLKYHQFPIGERMFNFIESGKHIFCVNEDLSVVLCLHKMVVDLKFSRFEDQPWGFRLTGGKDFPLPLTVVKVSKFEIY